MVWFVLIDVACARVLGWLVWVFWFAGLVVFILRCRYFLQACWLLRLAAVLSVGLALLGVVGFD